MIDADSRYAGLALRSLQNNEGREITYLTRRIISAPGQIAAEIAVQSFDRIDLVAHRAYGDARLFWRVADASRTRDVDSLCDTAGRRLPVTLVEPQ